MLSVASESVGAAAHIGSEMGAAGEALASAANQAFSDAMGAAFMVASVVALVASLLVLRYLPHRVDGGAPEPIRRSTAPAPMEEI